MTIARDVALRILRKTFGRKAACAAGALALAALWAVSPAEARVPFFNAACPGRIDVQADGGQVFINGQPARVKRFNEGYYEARLGGIARPDPTIPVRLPRLVRASAVICARRADAWSPHT